MMVRNPSDIDALIADMQACQPTGMAGVNTLYAAMLRHPGFDAIDFSRMRGAIAGGAPLSAPIAREWQRRTGTTLFEGYGLSETTASLCCNTTESHRDGTVGRTLDGIEIRLLDRDGRAVDHGVEGEICVRGPQVTTGYWQRPQATAEAIDAEGWFHTGDIGVMDADGYVTLVDRLKDMILVSGFNVYPTEIENVLIEHP